MAQQTILIAGPYRSGTHDEPTRMAENLRTLEIFALEVYRRGHLPLIGEWVALPLMSVAGSQYVGDTIYDSYAYPVALRLITICDAVLRIEGLSSGADEDVRQATDRGISIYRSLEEVPIA